MATKMDINPQKISELKGFINLCEENPSIIHMPEFAFFKNYLTSIGAKLPECSQPTNDTKIPTFNANDDVDNEEISTSSSEEDDNDQEETDSEYIPAENRPFLPLGSSEEKELTDEILDKISKLKEEAADLTGENKLEEALAKYTEILTIGNATAMLYTKRAAILLQLKCPNAVIRDCNEALKLNSDSAAAYKLRGKAYRLLCKWEEAHRDINLGQKLDYDESLWEMQKLVDEKFQKIHGKRLARQRKVEEKERKQKEKEIKKRREAAQKAYEEQKKMDEDKTNFPGGFPGGFPGNFPSTGGRGAGSPGFGNNVGDMFSGLNDPELKKMFENPKLMQAMQDIMKNPANISKYQNDPEIMSLMAKITSKFGGGMGGMGGMGSMGGMGGMGGLGGMSGRM